MTYPTIMPALTLDFQNSQQLDPRVTFSRSSSATYINSAGQVASAADHEARFDHDPVTGECLGLLVEESRTNQVLNSDTMVRGSEATTIGLTVTANATTAPDNVSASADLLVPTTGNEYHQIYKNLANYTGTSGTLSLFVKSSGYTKVAINAGTGNPGFTSFDISGDGSFLYKGNDVISHSIQKLSNGWFRISTTNTAHTNAYRYQVHILDPSYTTGTPGVWSGDGTSGMYMWGLQFEANAFPTSYIPTSGSTVTRAADVCTITGDNFSSWYSQSEGTVLVDVRYLGLPNNATLQHSFSFQTGNSGPRISLNAYGVNSRMRVLADTGGDVYTGDTFSVTELRKCAVGYKINDLNFTFNGSRLGTDTSYTPTTSLNRLVLDTGHGGSPCSKHISRLSYYNQRLTDAELQTITL